MAAQWCKLALLQSSELSVFTGDSYRDQYGSYLAWTWFVIVHILAITIALGIIDVSL